MLDSEVVLLAPLVFVRRPRLKESIVDHLRRAILDGSLPAGTILRQEQLARQLTVSRMPLREALGMLEREGLVTVSLGGVASVVSLDARDARDVMDVREMIDGLAARTLAERGLDPATDAGLAALTREMHALAGRDQAGYLEANAAFHVRIVDAAQNKRLQQFAPLVRMSSEAVYLRLRAQHDRLADSAGEHDRVLDAIRSGDGALAERVARGHVRNAASHWLTSAVVKES
jgi:DNA-binding GntR family transcriptional regulator